MKIKINNFTLTEIVVSLGIFAIIAMLLMQFFSTAQNAWTSSEKRARAYADSRVLFDLMDSALKSSKSNDGFTCTENGPNLKFTGVVPFRLANNPESRNIEEMFFNFDEPNSAVTIQANGGTVHEIISGVKSFTVLAQNESWTGVALSNGSRPAFISVTLEMFGNDTDYQAWKTLNTANTDKGDDYFNQNGYTFTRLFALPR